MKRSLKLISFMLVLASFVLAFSACGGDNNKETGTQAESETEARIYLDDVPEMSFAVNGSPIEYRVISPTSSDDTYTQFDAEDASGPVLDSSLYIRNRQIEERFDVIFESSEDTYTNCALKLSNEVKGDLHDTNLFMIINRDAITALSNGEILTIHKLPYIDPTKDYYLQDVNDAMKINGVQLLCYSDESIYTYQRTTCIAFNYSIQDDYSIENLYDLVDKKTWTFEKMYSLMKQTTTENQAGETDVYGFFGFGGYTWSTFFTAANQFYIAKNGSDFKLTASGNQKMVKIADDILAWQKEGVFGYNQDWGKPNDYNLTFVEGKCFMLGTVIGKLTFIKEIDDFEYGILPYPLYDETQKDYYSRIIDAWLRVVPSNTENAVRDSAILEALASGSSQIVFPAFYDQNLKYRYVRNEESVEMLELIRRTRTFDWGGVTYTNYCRGAIEEDVFMNEKYNFNTGITSIIPIVKARINEVIELSNKLKAEQ